MATVSSAPRTTIETVGAPSAGPFNVGFRLFQSDALTVYVNQIERTDFTVTASYVNGYTDSASITFDAPLANLDEIQIDGSLAPARAQDYISTQPNLVPAMNIELARLWSSLSEVNLQVGRSIRTLSAQDPVAGFDASDLAGLVDALADAEAAASAAAASAAAALVSEGEAEAARDEVLAIADLLPDWQGAWVTATAYEVGDLVKQGGNVYICLVAHTAGTFSTDLSALRWELFVERGAAGAGTGDVLAANNGSDFANAATTLSNLGGQPVNANLTAESGLTGAADRVSYFTGVGAKALATLTAFGRTLISAADAAAARTSLGLGTLAQLNFLEKEQLAANMIQTTGTWEAGVGTDDTAVSPAKVRAAIAAYVDSGWTYLTPQTGAGDFTFTFSGPDEISEMEVFFDGLSLNGTDDIIVRLYRNGSPSVPITTGYLSHSAGVVSATNGFLVKAGSAARLTSGQMKLVRLQPESLTWISSHSAGSSFGGFAGGGHCLVGGGQTIVGFTVASVGANAFDAGQVGGRWR